MYDLALSALRNHWIEGILVGLKLQVLYSLGLPRIKRSVVTLFTYLFKL